MGAAIPYRNVGGTWPNSRISGYLWERNIEHSIRPDGTDGFLLPYRELVALAEDDASLDLGACTAFARPADGAFLDHAGIPERTARNMVRLAKAGLQPQIISALGGVAETLDLLKTVAGWGNARVAVLGGTERALLFAHAVRRSQLWAETCLEGAESATERGAIRQSWPDGPVSAARWLAFGNAVEDAQSEPERREAWELRPWARARLKNACNAPLVLNQYVGTIGGL